MRISISQHHFIHYQGFLGKYACNMAGFSVYLRAFIVMIEKKWRIKI